MKRAKLTRPNGKEIEMDMVWLLTSIIASNSEFGTGLVAKIKFHGIDDDSFYEFFLFKWNIFSTHIVRKLVLVE